MSTYTADVCTDVVSASLGVLRSEHTCAATEGEGVQAGVPILEESFLAMISAFASARDDVRAAAVVSSMHNAQLDARRGAPCAAVLRF